MAEMLQSVLLRQLARTNAGPLGFEDEPLLEFHPFFLLDVFRMFLQQLVAPGHVEILMINAAIQVQRNSGHIDVLALRVMQFFSCNVIHKAITGLGGGHDVIVVIDGVRLQGRACGVGAGPNH